MKGVVRNLLELAVAYRQQISRILDVSPDESSDGELAAMVSFAIAFPDGFMALVDTYDVKRYFALRSLFISHTSHTHYLSSLQMFCFYLFFSFSLVVVSCYC